MKRLTANIVFLFSATSILLYYMYIIYKSTNDIFTVPIISMGVICFLVYGFIQNLENYGSYVKGWLKWAYAVLCVIVLALLAWNAALIVRGEYKEIFQLRDITVSFFQQPSLIRFYMLSTAYLPFIQIAAVASGFYLARSMKKEQHHA